MTLRKLFYTLGLLLGALLSANAQCEDMTLTVWPDYQTKTIQPRQLFLVYSSTQMQSLLMQRCQDTKLYLWSPEDSVSLRLLDCQHRESGDMQLLLQPSQPLQPGCDYELRAEFNVFFINHYYQNWDPRTKRQSTRYKWQVAAADQQAPLWLATPTAVRKEYSENSEGVNNYVLFSCPLRDSSAYIVKVVVQRVADKVRTTSYVLPWQNCLPIGWLTCSGDVDFQPNEEYTVTFEALDAAGNRAQATSSPVSFESPPRKNAE